MRLRRKLCPGSRWGAYSAPPGPLLHGYEKEEKGEQEGKGGEREGKERNKRR